jgi:hypothetical protein
MRIAPSLTIVNPTQFYVYQTASTTCTAVAYDISDVNTMLLVATVASGLTSPTFYTLGISAATGQANYSAEL